MNKYVIFPFIMMIITDINDNDDDKNFMLMSMLMLMLMMMMTMMTVIWTKHMMVILRDGQTNQMQNITWMTSATSLMADRR